MPDALVCPSCYTTSEVGTAFCRDCGSSLAAVEAERSRNDERLTELAERVLKAGSVGAAREQIDGELTRLSGEIKKTLAASDALIPVPNTTEWVRSMKAEAGIDPDREELSVLEATHLGQAMNLNTGYGRQLNAFQVQQLCQPFSAAGQGAFYKAYNAYYRRTIAGPLGGRVWLVAALVAIIGLVMAMPREEMSGMAGFTTVTCLLLLIYSAVRADRINTHWDGFFSGFSDGKREGFLGALGLDCDEDRQDVRERAEEMERYARTFDDAEPTA